MAVVLGIEVVAEGVEEDAERKLLKKIGCSIGQGFFWSKALPDEELLEYLKNQDPVIVS